MKEPVIDDFAAVIGVDWADKKHDVCEIPTGSSSCLYSVILNKPQALNEWAMSLKERYPDQSVAVACELKKGPLIYALSKFDHITLFPVNPSTLAKYRQAFTTSGAKNDPTDAFLQADILIRHWDKFVPILPESPKLRMLAQLLEYRRKLVQDRVDLSNSITAYLKNYYPQVLDWFKEKDTIIFCDFLAKWSTLAAIKKARKQTLLDFQVAFDLNMI